MPRLLILNEEQGHGGVHTVSTVLQAQLQARGWTVETQAVRGQRLSPGSLWRAARQADVLLASNNFRPAYVAVLLGRLSRRPSVVWVHGPLREVLAQAARQSTPAGSLTKPLHPALQKLRHLLLRKQLQLADARVCVSETSRQSLLAWLGPGAAETRLVRNPAPACLTLADVPSAAAPDSLPLPALQDTPAPSQPEPDPPNRPPRAGTPPPVRIGCVTRLSPEKRPGLALQALRLLPAHHHLTLLGDGPLQDSLSAEGRDLLHNGRLQMPGAQTVTLQTYADWDLSLLCAAYEGYPMAALESLAAGVACVGPPLPALQEMLGPQAAKWLAEDDSPAALARAVERCLQTPVAQRRQQAQAIARQHDVDSFGARWDRLLRSLIRPACPGGRAP